MKFLTNTMKKCLAIGLVFLLTSGGLWAQIQFVGLYSEGEGGAAWDADGTGEEAYGNGHGGVYYYTASRDYVDASSTSGGHMVAIDNDFPFFEIAMMENNFTYEQLTMKLALSNMGDDIEGIDWFTINNVNYANFYHLKIVFELDGEPMIEAIGDYSMYISSSNAQDFESGYMKVHNISNNSSLTVQNVATAFLFDVANDEIKCSMDVSYAADLIGNGRSGGYFDVNCTFEKGAQKWPYKGLVQDHEGFAAWDADGSGLEPDNEGHGAQLYYSASLDYVGLDPDPDACMGHFLEGSTGFLNTQLQLEYNGLDISDFRIKMGLNSLGPDKEGEDWNSNYCNYYNIVITFELNEEPILEILVDTNRLNSGWICESSFGKTYNISENASTQAQNVAASLMKDIGTHSLKFITNGISFSNYLAGEGRDGAYYNIDEAYIKGVREKVTFVNEGSVSGNWTLENSPYYIEGHLLVENNEKLSIEPGVVVAIRGPYHFTVQGAIEANGLEENPIQFSSSNPNIYWDGFDYEGINIISEDPSVFSHCLFQYGRGGGSSSSPYVSGGIFAIRTYDDISIYRSTFRHNVANKLSSYPTCGGAIALWNASPMIQSCIFHDNEALDYGGAIISYAVSNPVISNCLFYDNESDRGGALAFYEYGNGILINNTIADNSALYGGGLYFYNQSDPEIINNILWNNEASTSGPQVYFSTVTSYPGFYYNDIEEGLEGFGGNVPELDYLFNIEEDPMFEDNEDFLYIQNHESACINNGSPDNSSWYYEDLLPEECLCGADRHMENRIDIGCYEVEKGVGIKDLNKTYELGISPNPVKTTALLQYDLEEAGMVRIEIFNLMGQQVEEVFHAYQKAGEQSYHLQAEGYHRGQYLLKISTADQTYLSKFIKY